MFLDFFHSRKLSNINENAFSDLEGLLDKLSPEELEDLNNDFDPDVSHFSFSFMNISILIGFFQKEVLILRKFDTLIDA